LFTNPRMATTVNAKTGLITGTLTAAVLNPKVMPVKAVIMQGNRALFGQFLNPVTKDSGKLGLY